MPGKFAVATNVFVVLVTALTASISHGVLMMTGGATSSDSIARLLIFSIPGVVLGGQIGPYLAARLPEPVLIRGLAVLFMVTGVFLTGGVILGGS